jgi:hypothetical protein
MLVFKHLLTFKKRAVPLMRQEMLKITFECNPPYLHRPTSTKGRCKKDRAETLDTSGRATRRRRFGMKRRPSTFLSVFHQTARRRASLSIFCDESRTVFSTNLKLRKLSTKSFRHLEKFFKHNFLTKKLWNKGRCYINVHKCNL